MNKTINYYDNNAQTYANSTISISMSKQIEKFVAHIPSGGKILDVGCGSGRDLIVFKQLGFNVQGIDASSKLVAIAQQNSGVKVETKQFTDIQWTNEFDGVWCLASLLHVPKVNIIDVFNKISQSLKDDGVLYASFKKGTGESTDNNDRFFSYYSIDELQELFQSVPSFEQVKISSDFSKDQLGRVNTEWIDLIVKKKPLQLNKHKKNKL